MNKRWKVFRYRIMCQVLMSENQEWVIRETIDKNYN